jgi:hypothetical protein
MEVILELAKFWHACCKFHVDLSKMLEVNYKTKIAKAENTLKMWKRR